LEVLLFKFFIEYFFMLNQFSYNYRIAELGLNGGFH